MQTNGEHAIPPDGGEVVSNLERVFGLTDPVFREYMLLANTRSTSPQQLLELSVAMETHERPIVRYAAGWAAAEAALYRTKPGETPPPYPFSERLVTLKRAKGLWNEVSQAFGDERRSRSSPVKSSDLWGFELRAKHAIAYLPNMRVVAALLSNTELPAQHITDEIERTKQQAMSLGETVLRFRPRSQGSAITRSGMCNEIVGGLLLQSHLPLQFTVVPASVRQDHHRSFRLRGDLLAVSAESPYRKTLIQITSLTRGNENGDFRFTIHADELRLTQAQSAGTLVLRAFIGKEMGAADDSIASGVQALSELLVSRLVAFDPYAPPS